MNLFTKLKQTHRKQIPSHPRGMWGRRLNKKFRTEINTRLYTKETINKHLCRAQVTLLNNLYNLHRKIIWKKYIYIYN